MAETKGVVDEEALNNYNKLKEHPALNDYRKYQSSNPHFSIDVAATKYVIKKQCKKYKIPEEEQRYIMARHQLFVIFNNKAIGYKKQAFGVTGKRAVADRDRLLDARKAELIELFGKFYSAKEVHKIVNNDWGIEVSIASVKNFRGKYLDQIKERQEEYKRDFSNVRLGHKRSRLDELSYLYDETKERYRRARDRGDMKFMKELLESIKKEVEGDVVTIQGDIKATIEHTLDAHMNNEIMPALSINEIIVSRVAGKLGLNPLFLLWKLQNSMYSKFTGFDQSEAHDPYEEKPIYPSGMIYDLEKLRNQNKERDVEDAEVLEEIEGSKEMNDTEKSQAKRAKELLKKRMQENLDKVEESQRRVDQVERKR